MPLNRPRLLLIERSFVGLTPGVLVCLGVSRWLAGLMGGRQGKSKSKKQGQMIRVLR